WGAGGDWRQGAGWCERAVGIVLLVAFERRAEHAENVDVRDRPQLVAVLGTDVIGHTRFELPGLLGREVRHLACAGEDMVRFPVVLVPEDRLGAGVEMHVREP